jgi:hypothetical protein
LPDGRLRPADERGGDPPAHVLPVGVLEALDVGVRGRGGRVVRLAVRELRDHRGGLLAVDAVLGEVGVGRRELVEVVLQLLDLRALVAVVGAEAGAVAGGVVRRVRGGGWLLLAPDVRGDGGHVGGGAVDLEVHLVVGAGEVAAPGDDAGVSGEQAAQGVDLLGGERAALAVGVLGGVQVDRGGRRVAGQQPPVVGVGAEREAPALAGPQRLHVGVEVGGEVEQDGGDVAGADAGGEVHAGSSGHFPVVEAAEVGGVRAGGPAVVRGGHGGSSQVVESTATQ